MFESILFVGSDHCIRHTYLYGDAKDCVLNITI